VSQAPVAPALSPFGAGLGRALALRGRDLLVAKDLATLVPALAPLEAYFIVKELGVGDAVPILLHATSEQLQAFVDLDCWAEGRPDAVELDAWLAPFAAEGPDELAHVFNALDEEQQILFLGDSLDVYDLRAEEDPETEPDKPRLTTPDGFFVIVPKVDQDSREVDLFMLIRSLYRASLEQAFRLLMAVKWEGGADTEERALHFRTGRLQDLGFPEPADAARLFTPPPKKRRRPDRPRPRADEPSTLPALYAAPLREGSLLSRALFCIVDAEETTRLERELIMLINTAVVGYGESPRHVEHVAEIAARVRDSLCLGLEALLRDVADEPVDLGSDAAVKGAAALLGEHSLVDIFRAAFREVAAVQVVARSLVADPVVTSWLERPAREGDDYSAERRDRAFLHALLAPRPLLSGFDAVRPEKVRAFASLSELAAARARLEAIAGHVA